MKKIVCLFLFIVLVKFSSAQNTFAKVSSVITPHIGLVSGKNGNMYLLIGAGNPDSIKTCIVKMDEDGNTLWSKTYYTNVGILEAWRILPHTDGGFFLTGQYHDQSNSDFLILKADSNGIVSWAKTYDRAQNEISFSASILPDGGIMLAGASKDAGFSLRDNNSLFRTDSLGNVLFFKKYYTTGYDFSGGNVSLLNDSTCLMIYGYKATSGALSKSHLVEIDLNGSIVNTSSIWTPTSNVYMGGEAQTLANGDFYLIGRVADLPSITRLNSAGIIQWSKVLTNLNYPTLSGLVETHDHKYLSVGISSDQFSNLFLLQLDSSANYISMNSFPLDTSNVVVGIASEGKDHGIFMAGILSPSLLYILQKTDSSGSSACGSVPITYTDSFVTLTQNTPVYIDSTFTITENPINVFDSAGIVFTDLCQSLNANAIFSEEESIKLIPNPVSSHLKIETTQKIDFVKMYNLVGESIQVSVDCTQQTVDCSMLHPGIYILQVSSNGELWRSKVIKR